MTPQRWFFNVLIALDVLLNAVLWGRKHETLSKRAAQARDKGQRWGCILCRLLDTMAPRHCDDALRWDP